MYAGLSINDVVKGIEKPLDTSPVHLIGYGKVKKQLAPFINQRVFPNLLVTGEPGVGKTHLARWIAYQKNVYLHEEIAPLKRRPREGSLVLLDECHLQRNPESLFRFMDEETSTLIAATTKPDGLDAAFESRFVLRIHLAGMDQDDSEELIRFLAKTELADKTVSVLASASAGNPRQAKQIIATAEGLDTWEPETILETAQITMDGLTNLHLTYLMTLSEQSRPMGLANLSSIMATGKQTLMGLEKRLTKLNLMELSPKGRVLTELGEKYAQMLKEVRKET